MEPTARTVDYYFAPQSPWCYLGHANFVGVAGRCDVAVALKPIDIGRVFAVSGGLPLAQRPKQRQTYRLLELSRYATHLGLPIRLQPRFFPVAADAAALHLIAADDLAGTAAALRLAGALGRAVWAEERDIADAGTLAAIVGECDLDAAAVTARATAADTRARYEQHTDDAIAAEVFGVPTFVPRFGTADGERFWGQDRLGLLEHAIAPR